MTALVCQRSVERQTCRTASEVFSVPSFWSQIPYHIEASTLNLQMSLRRGIKFNPARAISIQASAVAPVKL